MTQPAHAPPHSASPVSLASVTLRSLVAAAVLAAMVMGPAGTWQWPAAWAVTAVLAGVGFSTLRLLALHPDLARERQTAAARAPAWDRALVAALNALLPVQLVLAGLDVRWGWSGGLPWGVSAAGGVAAVAGAWVTYRAMATNAFFSSHIRIQADRGHVVTDRGVYGRVRHPGYAGGILFNVGIPLLLGSPVALVAGLAVVVVLVVRTALEDRILHRDLPGYADYAARVRFRLVPGVW